MRKEAGGVSAGSILEGDGRDTYIVLYVADADALHMV